MYNKKVFILCFIATIIVLSSCKVASTPAEITIDVAEQNAEDTSMNIDVSGQNESMEDATMNEDTTGESEEIILDKEVTENISNDEPEQEQVISCNYEIEKVLFEERNVAIQYPRVIGLDNGVQDKVNELLKQRAFILVDAYEIVPEEYSLDISYKVMWSSDKLLSVQYSGYRYYKGASYPVDLLYSVNIDMETGECIRLNDIMNITEEFLDKCYSYSSEEQPYVKEKIEHMIYDILDREYYKSQFINADSLELSNSGTVHSYFTDSKFGMYISVEHHDGDNIYIEFPYEEWESFMKNHKVWDEFIER